MNKIIFSAGILAVLSLAIPYTVQAQTSKEQADHKALECEKENNKMYTELKKDAGVTEVKSFKLDKEELQVNGTKLSPVLHKKYMDKYLGNSKAICSNCTISSEGKVTLHDEQDSK